jgi:hypothetical protein
MTIEDTNLVGIRSILQAAYSQLSSVVYHISNEIPDAIDYDGIHALLMEMEESLGDKIELIPYSEEQEDYNDSMDGDHESALASAGWGTDESYE